MTKKELVGQVAIKVGITDTLARKIVREVLSQMGEVLARGETLEFRGFGVLKTKIRKARIGRNPKAGTVVSIPGRKVVVWKIVKETTEIYPGTNVIAMLRFYAEGFRLDALKAGALKLSAESEKQRIERWQKESVSMPDDCRKALVKLGIRL